MKLLVLVVPLLLVLLEQFSTVHAQYNGIYSSGGSIQPIGRPSGPGGSAPQRPFTTRRPISGVRPTTLTPEKNTRRPPVANSPRPVGSTTQPMQLVYSWNIFDFNYPSEAARQEAINSGAFNAVNVSAVPSVAEAVGSRVFIGIPRWVPGIPAALSTVPYPSDTRSPRLTPYPNWEFNRQGNCNGFTSVARVKVDECNRLWVLDNGIVGLPANPERLCQPQIFVFDLNTDQVIHRFVLPNSVTPEGYLLVAIEVEYPGLPQGQCGSPRDAFVYIADSETFALIVADMSSGHAWRIRDKTMYPATEAGTFEILGSSLEFMDGVLGLALSPANTQPRTLYYNSLNNFRQNWVLTSVLRNETLSLNSPQSYQTGTGHRTSQCGDTAIDQRGVMFLGLLGEQTVACWNTRTPYQSSNIITLARDDETLQFPLSIQVDTSDRLWVMSTKFHRFALQTITPEETNFHVFMAPAAEVVRGTVCDTRQAAAIANNRG